VNVHEFDVVSEELGSVLDEIECLSIGFAVLNLFPEIILHRIIMPFAEQLQKPENPNHPLF